MSRFTEYLKSVGLPGTEPLLRAAGWNLDMGQRDGKDVAIVVSRGTEIHFAPLVKNKAVTRRNMRAHLSKVLDEFGFATTRFPIDNTDTRMMQKLGFTFQWSDENYSYWSTTELPWNKPSQAS